MKKLRILIATGVAHCAFLMAFAVPTVPAALVSVDKTTLTFTTVPATGTPKGVEKCYKMVDGDFPRDKEEYPEWHADYAAEITTVKFESGFGTSAKPTSCNGWFADFAKLKTITGIANLKTSDVTDMSMMFSGCSSLTELDLTSFDTAKVTLMTSMFEGCSGLNSLDVTKFDTAKVTDMNDMFCDCAKLKYLDLANFDTANVTGMESMFFNCKALRRILVSDKFVTGQVDSSADMFTDCAALVGAYGTKTDGVEEHENKSRARVDTMAQPGYFSYRAYAIYNSTFKTLTFKYKCNPSLLKVETSYPLIDAELLESYSSAKWCADHKTDIAQVVFDKSFENYKPLQCVNWFKGCTALAADAFGGLEYYLDTSMATSLRGMFQGCSNLTAVDLSGAHFVTENVTDMAYMFAGCEKLTSVDVSNFNTAKVTSMGYMFQNCALLASLDVSGFDTANVTYMANMFGGCTALKSLDLSRFNTRKVNAINMMFISCSALETIYATDAFEVKVVAGDMFSGCAKLQGGNGTKHGTDTTYNSATYARVDREGTKGLFSAAPVAVFNSETKKLVFYYDGLDHSSEGTVYSVKAAEAIVTPWGNDVPWHGECAGCVTSVEFDDSFAAYKPTQCAGWFDGFTLLTDVSFNNLDTSEVTSMAKMFYYCKGLKELDVSRLNTAKVTDMSGMFGECVGLTELNLHDFDTGLVTTTEDMFNGCAKLVTIEVSSAFDVSGVTKSEDMFAGCTSLKGGNETAYDAGKVDKTYAIIDGKGGKKGYFSVAREAKAVWNSADSTLTFVYDTEDYGAKDTDWFSVAEAEAALNTAPPWSSVKSDVTRVEFAESFGVYKPTNCCFWFSDFENLEDIDLEYLYTDNACSLRGIFQNCVKLTAVNFDTGEQGFITGNVRDMSYMFAGCAALKVISWGGEFDTSKVADMRYMFDGCTSLQRLDLSGFDTSRVEDLGWVFRGCSQLRAVDLGHFDTANVQSVCAMFAGCLSLERIYTCADLDFSNVTDDLGMFYGCTSLVGGNGTPYDDGQTGVSYAHLDVEGNPGYFSRPPVAVLSADKKTLTFYADQIDHAADGTPYSVPEAEAMADSEISPLWGVKSSLVDKVVFDASFADYRPANCCSWFYQFQKLATIEGIENLNTSRATSMSYMFDSCVALRSLDLSHFDTAQVTDTSDMFVCCDALERIYVSAAFDVTGVTKSDEMFLDCYSLVGGNDTAYDPTKVDKTYARIDAPGTSGYFTLAGSRTVTFDAHGGTATPATLTPLVDTAVGTLPTATRKGYDFEGWFTAAEGGDPVTESTVITKDVTFHAQWSLVTYAIAYELGGGVNAAVNPATYTVETPDVTLAAPTRTGYTFKGWTPSGMIAKGSAGDKVFTATWQQNGEPPAPEPDKVAVTFNANGGTAEETTRQVVIGAKVGALPIPTRVNYCFDGWFTAATGGERVSAETIVSCAVTYFAQWQAVSPDMPVVTFDAGNGTCQEPSRIVIAGEPIGTLPIPLREGYEFKGWFDHVSGGTQITAETRATVSFTAYAHWQVIDYPITVDLGGGTMTTQIPKTYTVEDAMTLGTPTRERYQFIGWIPTDRIDKGSTGAKSFTAQWMRVYPRLFDASESGEVNAKGATYNGFIGEGDLAGTFTLVLKKAKNGVSDATMTIVSSEGGKKKVKGKVDVESGVCSGGLAGLELSDQVVGGTLGEGSELVQGAVDAAKAKDADALAVMNAFNKKVYSLVISDALDDAGTLTATFSTKGKAKISGTVAGSKISGSAQMSVGDRYAAVPFVYVKKSIAVSFVLWFDKRNLCLYDVSGLGEGVELVAAGESGALPVDDYVLKLDREDVLNAVPNAIAETPVVVDMGWNGKKFDVGKAAKVKYDKKEGKVIVDTSKGNNVSSLALKYSKGALSGSFTVYGLTGTKLAKNKFTVSGVVIDGVGYATGVNKKLGSIACKLMSGSEE